MKKNDTNRRAVLGISGASGSIYALRLAKILLEAGADLYCIPTRAAVKILADETGYADFNTAIAGATTVSVLPIKKLIVPYIPGLKASFLFGILTSTVKVLDAGSILG